MAGFITFSFSIQDLESLESLGISQRKVLSMMGRVAVNMIKKRIRAGVDSQGRPIPKSKDKRAKDPLNRTGELLKSIGYTVKFKKGQGGYVNIFPRGKHSGTNASNFLILADTHLDVISLTASEQSSLEGKVQAYVDSMVEKGLQKLLNNE